MEADVPRQIGASDLFNKGSYELIIHIPRKQVSFIIERQWSGHNFAHVTTAQLSWHVPNYDLILSLETKINWEEFSQEFNWCDYKMACRTHPWCWLWHVRRGSHHIFRIYIIPLNTWHNNYVVITSIRRHFDVITSKWRVFDIITTPLLCNVSSGI